jgi:uncharacterized membrane protein YeaQ/YmgE (transglycosylase-associated protein family)
MGIAVWLVCAFVAFFLARLIPVGRVPGSGWWVELLISLVAAFLLGVAATALDFGGWREPDWRAALFALLGAFAAVGTVRAIRSPSSRSRPGPPPPRR